MGFRATRRHYELYDHILNALQVSEASFSIEEVTKIIDQDFNGFSAIVRQEQLYQQQLNKKYNKAFVGELLNTFRGFELINNLLILFLCVTLYYGSLNKPFNSKPIITATVLVSVVIAAFGFLRICWNKRRFKKSSILDSYLIYASIFGIVIVTGVTQLLLGKVNIFNLGEGSKMIALLMLLFFTSVYVRGFMKFYSRNFKVIAV